MKTNIIDRSSTSTFVISRGGENWLFEDGLTFTAPASPAIDAGELEKVGLIIEGAVKTTTGEIKGAIESLGRKTVVVVTESGSVDGGYSGVVLHGAGSEINNRGRIEGDFAGVSAVGDGFHLSNIGFIGGGTYSVYMSGNGATLTNLDGGLIHGMVDMSGEARETLWFNNDGLLIADLAVQGGASDDVVYNTGEIRGGITLGDGNDVLDTRFGKLTSFGVDGGKGDDMIMVSDARYHLIEAVDGGTDTVKSKVSYTLSDNVENLFLLKGRDIDGTGNAGDNRIVGSAWNNELNGLDGNDILDGRRGNDVLTGGAGKDVFVFGNRYDMDVITDFTHGEDVIDLGGWTKFDNFRQVMRAAENHGDDLWIIAGKDMLVIEGQSKADMHAHDFQF